MWLDEVPDDAIDSSNRTPLHTQLSSVLRARVVDGTLPAGTRFPTEAELQQRFGISRSVVRQSLLALTAEGLIERGRGRGSVVAPRGEHHRLVQRISGLSTQLSEVTTEVIRIGPTDDARAREILQADAVTGMLRLRSAAGEPIAVIETWLAADVGGAITTKELTDASLHAVLRDRFAIVVAAGDRQVRGVAASAGLATQLDIEPGDPLLLLEGTSVDEAGAPVELFRTWHRGDRVVFDIDVLPGSVARTAVFDGTVARTTLGSGDRGNPAVASRLRDLARELADLSEELRDR